MDFCSNEIERFSEPTLQTFFYKAAYQLIEKERSYKLINKLLSQDVALT